MELFVVNVLLAAIVDTVHHSGTQLKLLANLDFPPSFVQWRKLASIALVVYIIVHVSRRWKQFRRSHIQ